MEDEVVNVDMARLLLEKMVEFGGSYKKKSKKERRESCY